MCITREKMSFTENSVVTYESDNEEAISLIYDSDNQANLTRIHPVSTFLLDNNKL